jgi:hypothetical protein
VLILQGLRALLRVSVHSKEFTAHGWLALVNAVTEIGVGGNQKTPAGMLALRVARSNITYY